MFDSFASNSRFDFVGRWYDSLTGRNKWIETEASATSYLWEDDYEGGGGDYVIRYFYEVNGEYYPGRFRSESIVEPNTKLPVRYKPSNPNRHYLSDRYSAREPLVLAVIAFGFLLWWSILKLMSLGYY